MLLSSKSVCVFVCVHPEILKAIRTYAQIINQTSPSAFQFLYITLAID